jgi:hypothetical protein
MVGGVRPRRVEEPDMPDDLYDERLERRRRRDTALQAVVDELVGRSEGRPVDEVRADLEATLAERDLPVMPDGWLDAVSTAATIGDPYVVSAYAEHEDDVPPAKDHHTGRSID